MYLTKNRYVIFKMLMFIKNKIVHQFIIHKVSCWIYQTLLGPQTSPNQKKSRKSEEKKKKKKLIKFLKFAKFLFIIP